MGRRVCFISRNLTLYDESRVSGPAWGFLVGPLPPFPGVQETRFGPPALDHSSLPLRPLQSLLQSPLVQGGLQLRCLGSFRTSTQWKAHNSPTPASSLPVFFGGGTMVLEGILFLKVSSQRHLEPRLPSTCDYAAMVPLLRCAVVGIPREVSCGDPAETLGSLLLTPFVLHGPSTTPSASCLPLPAASLV